MRKTFVLMMVVLGTAISIQSCKKDNTNYMMSNQDFVTQASSSNMFEIAAANLAVNNKSTNTNVKAFGSHMITEHGQTAKDMATLANQKGLTVPAAMSAKEQTNYNTLAALSGTAFDKQYALMMVNSHQETITLFQTAAGDNGVPDGDLRSFASGKLPALQEHLSGAQTLQTQVQ